MKPVFRLLDTGLRSAAENLALDEVILRAVGAGEAPPTLRFLRFSPAAVLLGYHQVLEQEVRLDYCREQGIDIARRITGGGTLYWDAADLGWEVITPGSWGRAADAYRRLCLGAAAGLRRLGIDAAFRPANDIEVQGRKISGTGGTAGHGATLFQGTLLVDYPVEQMVKSLRLPTEKLRDKAISSFRERVTWVRRELGRLPASGELEEVLSQGLAEVLGVDLEPAGLTPWEETELQKALPRFASREWIHRRSAEGPEEPLTARHKAPGGLIRVAAAVRDEVLLSVLITGDFFAFPERLILDLEAALKHTPLLGDRLRERVHAFFAEREWEIPGVAPEDFVTALSMAVEKRHWHRQGFDLGQTGKLFPLVQPLEEVRSAPVLLLPYCAKPIDCEYRFRDGCDRCGRCTVGDAYAMAEERGMRVIGITRYEHLEATLQQLKEEGVSAFVGACCAPFYEKHQADFTRIGLPGLLVDIEDVTCYDLGEDAEAHAGVFRGETRLDLPLLEKVLDHGNRRD